MNSLTPLKAVIWDVDGTMIDSEEMQSSALLNLAFAKHNLGWVWTENLYAPFAENNRWPRKNTLLQPGNGWKKAVLPTRMT